MYPFVESLRIENGEIYHLRYHNERLNRTRQEVFGCSDRIDLAGHLAPQNYKEITKCRIEYNEQILSVEYHPYVMRLVKSLRLVECDGIDYHYKSTDRTLLNQLFEQRGSCDDILIVRGGLLTDTSAANVALFDGDKWYTPTTPLLEGTQRAYLLDEGKIHLRNIRPEDLSGYQSIRLFNAMIDFGRIELPVSRVLFRV